ncbi:MAG: RNA methyltransferase [Alphaproteobacteria bacterium]|nr:RNA methyltransferase [Alphaproteobacteria bacterium]
MKDITSPANPIVKKIKSLAIKKYRDEYGLFFVEGEDRVREMLEAGWECDALLYTPSPSGRGRGPATAGRERETLGGQSNAIPSPRPSPGGRGGSEFQVTPEIMQRITGRDNAQDVLGVFKPRWHDMPQTGEVYIALEGVRDPGNLGTVIRTAEATGMAGVILLGQTCDPWSPEVVRATVGSLARVPLIRATANDLKKWQGKIYGTHLEGAVDYRTVSYDAPLIIMMGSEQSGLSSEAVAVCDTLIKIPMTGAVESLNLGVSAGVVMYEILRADK